MLIQSKLAKLTICGIPTSATSTIIMRRWTSCTPNGGSQCGQGVQTRGSQCFRSGSGWSWCYDYIMMLLKMLILQTAVLSPAPCVLILSNLGRMKSLAGAFTPLIYTPSPSPSLILTLIFLSWCRYFCHFLPQHHQPSLLQHWLPSGLPGLPLVPLGHIFLPVRPAPHKHD